MIKAIEFKNFSYAYQSDWTFKRKVYVKNVSLDVYEGESFGFLGRNGAGKTTSIKSLVGLTKPTTGEVLIYGKNSNLTEVRKQIGFLPEQPYFYDHIKAEEVVEMAAILKELPRSDIKSEVQRVMQLVKIDHKVRSKLRNMSKGQVQRVAMAQALVGRPKILILDEPFSGLDPIGRKEFADLLFQVKKEGTTIFICSHILSDIEFLCERVAIMAEGNLRGVFNLKELPKILPGTYDLIVKDFNHIQQELTSLASSFQDQDKFLHLKFENEEQAKKALRMTVDANAQVVEFKFSHGGLEELFLKQTDFNRE